MKDRRMHQRVESVNHVSYICLDQFGTEFCCGFGCTVDVCENGILLETEDLTQLDRAFNHVASRGGAVEGLHHSVNSLVEDVFFALYRDFPDPVRKRGEEKF